MYKEMRTYLKFLLIPIAVILTGIIVGRVFFILFDNWAWIPVVLVYWSVISLIMYLDHRKTGKKPVDYFKGFKFKISSVIISLIVGTIPLPIILNSFELFNSADLIIFWILIAVINPFFEEIFWRGFMLDKFPKIKFWIKAVISSFLFAIAHPLTWGVFSDYMLSVEMLISVFIMGIAWSFVYKKTNSLLLPYFSHVLVDLFNCSVLVFMNLLPVMNNLYQ